MNRLLQRTIQGLGQVTALATMACLPLMACAQAPRFEVLESHRLGGVGGWDYLSYDATTQRLFISRGTHVQVVDAKDGRVVGDIADTPGVHGIAIATGLDKAYTSNGRDNSLTVFSPSTLSTIRKIATPEGIGPDFIAYDPASRQVLAFNGKSKNATVVNVADDRVVATIALAGKPEAAVADGRGLVFVDIEDTNALQVIDSRAGKLTATWSLPGCDGPSGLALDAASRRLFVACGNKTMVVVDAESGKTVSTLGIGDGPDAAVFDADLHLAFSSQIDGSLSIVQGQGAANYRVVQSLPTARGARTMALDAEHHRVFLVSADFEAPAAGSASKRDTVKPDSFKLLIVGEKH